MWQKFENSEYFLQFTQDNDFEICVTDYAAVWTAFFSKKAFIAQLKNSNEGLELPNDHDYIKKGIHMLTNLDQLMNISIMKEENGKILFISIKIRMGFIFCFECKLSKGSEEFYFEKITKPLFKTIIDLRASQTELRKELIKKDKEIEEYICEGGRIALKSLKTAPFNEEKHMEKFKSYEEYFGSTYIPATVIEKSVDVISRNIKSEPTPTALNIKEEPNSIKQEPNSIEQEPNSIAEEPNTIEQKPNNIKQESNNIKQEPNNIKQEPYTPVFEDTQSSASTSISCKQEVIKIEKPIRNNARSKRPKLNF